MRHIEVFENERATNYDNFVKTWILNYQFVIDTVPKLIDLHQPDAKEILVAGSGTGNEILKILNYGKNWSITGVDPSPDMVAIAKSKLKTYSEVTLIQSTTEELPKEKKYDVATSLLVLHFMKDDGAKQALLQSISDRLNSGAPLIILDIFGNEEEFSQNLLLLEKILPKETDGYVIKDRIASMPERIHPISENRLAEILNNAGFSEPVRFFQSAIYGGWITIKK